MILLQSQNHHIFTSRIFSTTAHLVKMCYYMMNKMYNYIYKYIYKYWIRFGKNVCPLHVLEKNVIVHRQSSLLSPLTVVLFGFVWPLAYISAGGLYTEAEKAALIWTLGAGTFFPLITANSTKRGETKFSWQCSVAYYQQLEKQILGNHNWHCYFEGLMADGCAILYSMGPRFFPNTHFIFSLLLTG